MAFWAENFGSETGLKDPKRQFRFMVEFQGIAAPQGGSIMVCKNRYKACFLNRRG